VTTAATATIARVYREEWASVVAGLTRRFADLDLAEEMAAEAFATAVVRWEADGVPVNPGAWIAMTARRKAIDRLRRESRRDVLHREALMLADDSPPEPVGAVEDDRLRLIFTCCHPALSMASRLALTLRIVGGLTAREIAHAFLVQESTMAQRLTRAKAKIKAAGIPFRVPDSGDLLVRTDGVLAVLYLVFNEGYLASGDDDPLRPDLTDEAIRLTRLVRDLLPVDSAERGETTGLLALMLLTEARAAARVTPGGDLVGLDEQDRGPWDRALIDEAHSLLRDQRRHAERGGERLGRYAILAEVNAVHIRAPHAQDTDWSRIAALYSDLERIDPSPLVTLNRAIAVSEHDSPEVALSLVEPLAGTLDVHHAFHTTRAELLRRIGRSAEALAAYDRAIRLTANTAEITHLTRRRDSLAASTNGESE
jgi:RNA polymerase sigma-70 factor (ECF subfamily)